MARSVLSALELQRLVDSHDFLLTRLQTVLVEFLSLNALSLLLIRVFGSREALLFQIMAFSFKLLNLADLNLNLSSLVRSESRHIDFRVV